MRTKFKYLIFTFITLLFTTSIYSEIKTIPSTCNDLLPEWNEYYDFIEEVAELWVPNSQYNAKKIYELIAISQLYMEKSEDLENPINYIIQKLVCSCKKETKTYLDSLANSNKIRNCFKSHINTSIAKAKKKYLESKSINKLVKLANQDKKKYRNRIIDLKQQAKYSVEQSLN